MKRHCLILIFFFTSIILPAIPGCKSESKVAEKPIFSGQRSFELLEKQCSFGPRPPKSAAHDSLMQWLLSFLSALADTAYLQRFAEKDYEGEMMRMANVCAKFGSKHERRILLAAHWDTRPWADRDPDVANRGKPILGANDGASGVAVLLHIAELIKKNPPPIGVDIVLFDGEDYGHEGDLSRYLMGSKYFARNTVKPQWDFMILLDMVGDADLRLPKEQFSATKSAPDLVESLWTRAKSMRLEAFADSIGIPIMDDHVPMAEIGVKAVDIIDFDYPYWHTLEDTPDKCSPKSLEQVGLLLVDIIYNPPKMK